MLGGGGGRGISHVGMLEALEEMQIPVDAIGGCSIGAFIGGLYAREGDLISTTGRTKQVSATAADEMRTITMRSLSQYEFGQFAGRMASVWRILSDLTYPFASYTTGHEFSKRSGMSNQHE